jgi:hypothetical protein
MAQAHTRDSHTEGEMLDYSIRNSFASFISSEFYGWADRGGVI